ncbi:MAG: bifunctional phosphoribosylaminoimidazolecarboxamide formyltransferase/IMP cyclohydrolase [Dehalococcoidia bacterium]
MPVAILAPHDKTGLTEFAQRLVEMGYEIYSTGGTRNHLSEVGVAVQPVSALTGFPEVLDGRVKTLHPAVHAGILARRDLPAHMAQLAEHGIAPIDIVCANLYPFRETIAKPGVTIADALENIDIGGPTMIRAAAKNHPSVLVLVDPDDYSDALEHLATEQLPLDYRKRLAAKAFQHVAAYDTMIARYLRDSDQLFPRELTIGLDKVADTRYGENPHQRGAVYRDPSPGAPKGVVGAEQLHGLEMSYLNYFDADAAWRCAIDFDEPAVVIVKHGTPCGIASHKDMAVAYQRAYDSDPISPFGGIIAVNRPVTWDMTEAMKGKRYDIIAAPDYEGHALERLRKRQDLRILQMASADRAYPDIEYRMLLGGMLAHEPDRARGSDLELRSVTKRPPTNAEADELRFAWTCVKHVKSNAVVIAKDHATIGIGGGQPNRLWPTRRAIENAGERIQGSVMASDAFFPFARGDAVEDACRAGVSAIIQPGGGARDDEAIEVCDEYGVAMVFTGTRAFRH